MARRASASAASEFHAWAAAGRGRARAASLRTAAGKRRILRVPPSPADERPPRRVPRPRRGGGGLIGPGLPIRVVQSCFPTRGVLLFRPVVHSFPPRHLAGRPTPGVL